MKTYLKFVLLFSVAVFVLLLNVNLVLAANEGPQMPDSGIIPNGNNQIATGNFQLNDFIQLAVNISKWILGITGSLSLLMFVYGGITMLISAGSSEKVNKAKQILTGAVVGLIIVFSSYTIIGFILEKSGFLEGSSGSWATTGFTWGSK